MSGKILFIQEKQNTANIRDSPCMERSLRNECGHGTRKFHTYSKSKLYYC